MFTLPIAAREARAASRRARLYHARWIIGVFGLIAIQFALWIARHQSSPGGEIVFSALAVLAQLYSIFAGVIVASDIISSERRENTLGLLFLTDLKPRHLLLGKLLSSSTAAFFGLLAFIPLLALPLLLGGVTLHRFLLLAAALAASLLLSISLGFLVSTIFRQGWAALTAGLLATSILGIGLPCLLPWLDDPAEHFWFASSSAAIIALFEDPMSDPSIYWQSLLFTSLLAVANFAIVSRRLVYIWLDAPPTGAQQKRLNLLRFLRFGNAAARRRLRRQLLDHNPLSWLANREQISSPGLLAFSSLSVASLLLGWIFASGSYVELLIVLQFVLLFLAHLFLFFRLCVASAYSLAEDRKSGALELLLSTPLAVPAIIRGRWHGLLRQFFGPALVIAFLHLVLTAYLAWDLDPPERSSLFHHYATLQQTEDQLSVSAMLTGGLILAANAAAAVWLGMWFGIRCQSSATAVWLTFSTILLAPWLAFLLILLAAELSGLNDLFSDTTLFDNLLSLSSDLFALAYALALIFLARRKLAAHFRAAAANRFDVPPFRLPWRPILRGTFGAALPLALILALAWQWRENVNARGAALWATASARHAGLLLDDTPALPPIPDHLNLAKCPLLLPIGDRRAAATLNPGRLPVHTLKNHFAPNFRIPGLAAMPPAPPFRQNHWASGQLIPLDPYKTYLLKTALITNSTLSPAQAILASFAKYDPLLEELRLAAEQRPLARFDDESEPLAEISQILRLRSVARLRLGQPATTDIHLILRLAHGVHHLSTSGRGHLRNVFQPIFEGLALHRFTAPELASLQKSIAELDLWSFQEKRLRSQIRGSVTSLDNHLQYLRDDSSPARSLFGRLYPPGRVLEYKTILLNTGAEILPKILLPGQRRVNPDFPHKNDPPIPAPSFLSLDHLPAALSQSTHHFAYLQTTLNQIQIACALERFRLDRGHLPAQLTELNPTYHHPRPPDRRPRAPPPARPAPDQQSYTLHSVGWDLQDNLGHYTPSNQPELPAAQTDWPFSPPPHLDPPADTAQ